MGRSNSRNSSKINAKQPVKQTETVKTASDAVNVTEKDVKTEKIVYTGPILEKRESEDKPLALLETLWFSEDYGSIIDAYALDKAVKSFGWDTALLNKPCELCSEDDEVTEAEKVSEKFIEKYCTLAKKAAKKEQLEEAANSADAVIVGTGDVWSYEKITKDTGNRYYLDYVHEGKKKLSYGSSFGYTYTGPFGEAIKSSAKNLRHFDAVSVNNFDNVEMARDYFGIDADVVADPIFMCGNECFETIAANASCKAQEDDDDTFIVSYIRNPDPRKAQLVFKGNEILTPNNYSPLRNLADIKTVSELTAEKVKDEKKTILKAVSDMIEGYVEDKKEKKEEDTRFGLTPVKSSAVEDWLYYILNSEFLITDDYYAVCLALSFNKPFVFVESKNYEGMQNVQALLSQLGLEERIVCTEDDFKSKEYLFRMPIRYNKVNKVLDTIKKQSYEWLGAQLEVKSDKSDVEE